MLDSPGFHPTMAQLMDYSVRAIKDMHVSRIDFMLDMTINSLTFVFSNGVRAPPAKTYQVSLESGQQSYIAEPSLKYEIPKDQVRNVGALEFGSNEHGRLNLIRVWNRAN